MGGGRDSTGGGAVIYVSFDGEKSQAGKGGQQGERGEKVGENSLPPPSPTPLLLSLSESLIRAAKMEWEEGENRVGGMTGGERGNGSGRQKQPRLVGRKVTRAREGGEGELGLKSGEKSPLLRTECSRNEKCKMQGRDREEAKVGTETTSLRGEERISSSLFL